MSRIKQRVVTQVTDPDEELTSASMGDISANVSSDTSINIGYAESNGGLWFRIINTNAKNLTITSATPGASSTPVVDTIDTSTKSRLYIAVGGEWVVASSLYEKIFITNYKLKINIKLYFLEFLFLLYRRRNNYLCCLKN